MGKKKHFQLLLGSTKLMGGKMTKEGNQLGFELFGGYPGWV